VGYCIDGKNAVSHMRQHNTTKDWSAAESIVAQGMAQQADRKEEIC
jgi:hypothetical protein